jgi:mannose-6-phosphate isomerase
MNPLGPLRFQPLLRRTIWGGRRLGTLLGKTIGPESDYAESWEICDHGDDQTTVAAGPLMGATLHDLVAEHGRALLGRHHPRRHFPLLVKFLDAAEALSVQVHPNDAMAARLDPPELGKTEAWVVIAAEPHSAIYAGLKPGIDRARLAEALRHDRCEEVLHRFEPNVGDCVFLPAGTVHALGAGLVVAEIQQASDVTYRLFDWDRLGPNGRLRPLHVEQALEATDFSLGPIGPSTPEPTGRPGVERLAACDAFVLDRWRLDAPGVVGGDDRCHVLVVLGGAVRVEGDPAREPLRLGATALLPAAAGEVAIDPAEPSVLLCARLP